jgi:hypothetical protein
LEDKVIDQELYQIEIAGRLATMYVVGHVPPAARQKLIDACNALPSSVQVLRVSLDEFDQLGEGAPTVIHELRRHWQSTRHGSFRVAVALGASVQTDMNAVLLAG